MQRHICSLQVSRMCGAHALSADHLTALYTAFTLHYEHGLNAFGIDMLPTDMGLSDAYALLAGELGHFRLRTFYLKPMNNNKNYIEIFFFILSSSRDVRFSVTIEDIGSFGGSIMFTKLLVEQ